MTKKYEVEVTIKKSGYYYVVADDEDTAGEIARDLAIDDIEIEVIDE